MKRIKKKSNYKKKYFKRRIPNSIDPFKYFQLLFLIKGIEKKTTILVQKESRN